jgi:hypothetical protein
LFDVYKQLLRNQYEASLCTLAHCVDRCPDTNWNAPVAKYTFSQVVYHTLFFADFYLGRDEQSFFDQEFHKKNKDLFADYEQLKDQEPTLTYSCAQIRLYGDFCRGKALSVVDNETEASLCIPAKFERRDFTRAELHVYNIRHLQHHAAQLILRLRCDANVDVPWIGSGWRNAT